MTAFRRDFTVPSESPAVRSSTFSVAGSMVMIPSYTSSGASVTLTFAHGRVRTSPAPFRSDSMTLFVPSGNPDVSSAEKSSVTVSPATRSVKERCTPSYSAISAQFA